MEDEYSTLHHAGHNTSLWAHYSYTMAGSLVLDTWRQENLMPWLLTRPHLLVCIIEMIDWSSTIDLGTEDTLMMHVWWPIIVAPSFLYLRQQIDLDYWLQTMPVLLTENFIILNHMHRPSKTTDEITSMTSQNPEYHNFLSIASSDWVFCSIVLFYYSWNQHELTSPVYDGSIPESPYTFICKKNPLISSKK